MSTDENAHGLRSIRNLTIAICVTALLLHLYHYSRPVFTLVSLFQPNSGVDPGSSSGNPVGSPIDPVILIHKILHNLMLAITHTGIFGNVFISKLIALLFLGLSLMGVKGRKDEKFTVKSAVGIMGIGLLLYLGSVVLLHFPWVYAGLTLTGFLLILSGGVRLSRVIHYKLNQNDPFGELKSGFPQEERRIETDFSLHIPAVYVRGGKERKSWINIINPRRGVLIMGSPGCGKSWFLIEPLMIQLIQKGFAICLYDYKYDQLSRLAYQHFLINKDRYPPGVGFYHINFRDLNRSHRCNVLDPATLEQVSDAIGASRTILLSMNRAWIHRQGEFFVESPISFLAAIIWFLRQYQGGKFCTLPHAIELAQIDYATLFSVLNSKADVRTLIKPFADAFVNKTLEMLDGQVASARIPLARIGSPELYYVLTGDDCSLDINVPEAPRIFCLGGDPPRADALGPVLSLYIDRLNKRVNQKGRYPCAIIADEFATIRSYSMTTTIATGRSNNIVPVLAVQDLSQLRTQYTRDEADQLLNICSNVFCGQVGGDTARWISERIPRVLQDRMSVSSNSNDTSISQSQAWDNPVNPATIAGLSSGEFVGFVGDEPENVLKMKAFHAKIRKEDGVGPRAGSGIVKGGFMEAPEIPVVRQLEEGFVDRHFLQIKEDILSMVKMELGRMLNDEDLVGWVVKK